MLKKTIKYEGLDGEEVSEDHYFHLTQAELVELEMSHKGGLSEMIKRVIATEDGKVIMEEIKKIILMAYGVRSLDGKKFIKNQELRDDFVGTGAYSALFMSLVTNENATAEFINGIIPAKLAEEVAKLETTRGKSGETKTLSEGSKSPTDIITSAAMLEMTHEELQPVLERIRTGELVVGE